MKLADFRHRHEIRIGVGAVLEIIGHGLAFFPRGVGGEIGFDVVETDRRHDGVVVLELQRHARVVLRHHQFMQFFPRTNPHQFVWQVSGHGGRQIDNAHRRNLRHEHFAAVHALKTLHHEIHPVIQGDPEPRHARISDRELLGATGDQPTRFAVVRYGNVAGSRGSIVPFFNKLIASGARELPITDPRMTRFWITLDHGVDFVIQSFARMHGGEVFVPKIPSIRIVDLAQAMSADLPHKHVGIRPGEKLHELMVPLDDARMTLEFSDHYTIVPSIRFNNVDTDFSLDAAGEQGTPVGDSFEYRSDINPHFLSVDEIGKLHADITP